MILSDKKYIDPSEVINYVPDEFGKYIVIGEQQDVGEFSMLFLSRIQEAFVPNQKEE